MSKRYRGQVIKFHIRMAKTVWEKKFRYKWSAFFYTKLAAELLDRFVIDKEYGIEWIVTDLETNERLN